MTRRAIYDRAYAAKGDILVGTANDIAAKVGVGSNGQVLTAASGEASGVKWSNVDMSSSVVTGASQAVAVNTEYICDRTSAITFTLPATSAVGEFFKIVEGHHRSGWIIAQNANQYIYLADTVTTVGVGGSITSVTAGTNIELRCVVADLAWIVTDVTGEVTVT